jgi:hypothetical protein
LLQALLKNTKLFPSDFLTYGFVSVNLKLNLIHMKTRKPLSTHAQKPVSKKHRPEIRDDLDNRQNREVGFVGDISKKGDRKKKQKGG